MSQVTDDEVIQTYRATVGRLFGSVCGMAGGDRALAEDVVQETYLRAVKQWRARGLPDSPEAWLRTVARNLLVSHSRRGGRTMTAQLEPDSVAAVDHGTRLIERVALQEGFGRVSAARAALLRAFHIEGRSVQEIADRSALSPRAVEGRLRRARQALARAVGRR